MPRTEAEKIIFKFDNGSRIKLAKEIREEMYETVFIFLGLTFY
jgi:hypothetical protein